MRAFLKALVMSVLVLLDATSARSDATAPQVKSLYNQKSWLPNFHIPFRVLSGTISEVSVESSSGADACKAIRDSFYSDIVLVRCSVPTTAHLNVVVKKDGVSTNLRFGPLAIAKPSGVTQIDPTGDPDLAAGQAQFTKTCKGCHQPGGSGGVLPNNLTNLQVRKALKDLAGPVMPLFVGDLPEADVDKIALYLRSL